MSAPESRITVDQAHGLRRMAAVRPVKVITVTGGKGGVGKTNIAANLAVCLADLSRRVMLLDADLGLANVDVLFGLHPRYNLSDVINGRHSLKEIIVEGPGGIRIVPGASGIGQMASLDQRHHVGLIHAFSEIGEALDVLIVDTAPGISDDVLRFAEAAHEVLVVVCDEPTSITDAYAIIKILSRDRGLRRFQVVTNMTRDPGEGAALFHKLLRVTDRFLDVSLQHAGSLPFDDRLRRAVQQQNPVVSAYPGSLVSQSLKKLAARADKWDMPRTARGNIEFFMERLVRQPDRPVGLLI